MLRVNWIQVIVGTREPIFSANRWMTLIVYGAEKGERECIDWFKFFSLEP